MKWLKRKAETFTYYLIERVVSDTVEDDYNEGEKGNSVQTLSENPNEKVESVENMLKYLNSSYGLSEDKKDYHTISDSQIGYAGMTDEDGNWVETDDELYKAWKKGEAKLWSTIFTIVVSKIESKGLSEKDLTEMGFKE